MMEIEIDARTGPSGANSRKSSGAALLVLALGTAGLMGCPQEDAGRERAASEIRGAAADAKSEVQDDAAEARKVILDETRDAREEIRDEAESDG